MTRGSAGDVPRARPATVRTVTHYVPNGAGWHLALYQTWDEARLDRARRPVLIVPGYGMNSYIFSFHPRGPSLEGYLVEQGYEVFRVDLRQQGGSVSVGGGDQYGLEDLALVDLGAAIDAALDRARGGGASAVDVIGASLGGTMMFVHAVANPAHRMGTLVSMGGPVRWVKVHPLIRVMFASETVAGMLRLRGTRGIAEAALPRLARHVPWALSIYMNPAATDTSAARDMVKTVEDPNRHVNREIARWVRERDLVVRGANVSEAIARIEAPLLCIYASHDGIVPPETARFPYERVASRRKVALEVGDRDLAMAHADLFLSNGAHERVFRPIAEFLAG